MQGLGTQDWVYTDMEGDLVAKKRGQACINGFSNAVIKPVPSVFKFFFFNYKPERGKSLCVCVANIIPDHIKSTRYK